MKKIFSTITFAFIFVLFGIYSSANASTLETFDDIKNFVNQELGNSIEIYELNQYPKIQTRSSYSSNETLKFDSKEEFVEFIKELKENEPIIEKEEIFITNDDTNDFRNNSRNAVAHYRITPTIKNMRQPFSIQVLVNYNYTPLGIRLNLINSVNSVDSYSTLIALADWRQSTFTVNNNVTYANIGVYGIWEYKVEVKGTPVGFRVSDSYMLSLS